MNLLQGYYWIKYNADGKLVEDIAWFGDDSKAEDPQQTKRQWWNLCMSHRTFRADSPFIVAISADRIVGPAEELAREDSQVYVRVKASGLSGGIGYATYSMPKPESGVLNLPVGHELLSGGYVPKRWLRPFGDSLIDVTEEYASPQGIEAWKRSSAAPTDFGANVHFQKPISDASEYFTGGHEGV